jgi:hypothetical protein
MTLFEHSLLILSMFLYSDDPRLLVHFVHILGSVLHLMTLLIYFDMILFMYIKMII